MSLVYRPNIEELSNAISMRHPYREPNFYSTLDKTYGLFKSGKLESMINNIFVFDKQDITDLAIISEMSIFGFKVIETMDKILVSGSISDIVHLFKNCPDRTKFINTIYEDIMAYYSPEYFHQLVNFGIMDKDRFSPSYKDEVINDSIEYATLERISLYHCDLYTYSLTHHFDEVAPMDNNEYVLSRDKDNYICNTFGEAYKKLNISFFHLSKILNISYFIYNTPLNEATDFINKNNISKYAMYRSIDIMGHTKNDVILVTTSLYDFMSTFQTYKSNIDIYESLSDGFRNIIDDMESLFNIINNSMINTVEVNDQLNMEESKKVQEKIIKNKPANSIPDDNDQSMDKFLFEVTGDEQYNPDRKEKDESFYLINTDGGRNLFRDVKSPQMKKLLTEESPENKEIKPKSKSMIRRVIDAILNK